MTTNTTSNVKDIVIGGISANDLLARQSAIREDATKFVTEGVAQGKQLVASIVAAIGLEHTESDAFTASVEDAAALFEAIQCVSENLSIILHTMPYEGENVLSELLNAAIGDRKVSAEVEDLLFILQEMEYAASTWFEAEE